MSLNAPVPGLKHIHHDSKSFAKVYISVAPDEHLMVSADVAEQLIRTSAQFKPVDVPASVPRSVASTPVVTAADDSATPKRRAKKAAAK